MSSIFTAEELEAQLTAWKAALIAVSKGQEHWIDGEKITRADLPRIRETLEWLGSEKQKLATSTRPPGRTFAKQGGGGRW